MIFIISVILVARVYAMVIPTDRPGDSTGTGGTGGGTGGGNGTGSGPGEGNDTIRYTEPYGGGGGGAEPTDDREIEGGTPIAGGGGGVGEVEDPQEAPVQEPAETEPSGGGGGGAGYVTGDEAKPGAGSGGGTGDAGASNPAGGGDEPGSQQIIIPEELKWLIFIAVIVACAYVILRFVQKWLTKRRKALEKAKILDEPITEEELDISEDLIDEVTDVLKAGMTKLEQTQDIRLEIIRCYQRLCKALRTLGQTREPELTPREYWGETQRIFKLKSKSSTKPDPMFGLTLLFEEAVYSEHPMGTNDRDRARNELARTLRELEAWKLRTRGQTRSQTLDKPPSQLQRTSQHSSL
jgi:hypothetical protein